MIFIQLDLSIKINKKYNENKAINILKNIYRFIFFILEFEIIVAKFN